MNLNGFYTTAGLALAAKVAAGAALTVTKVTAGSGTTEASAAGLTDTRQTLTAGTAAVSGQTVSLPVTLAEGNASQSYTLTELGVFARDPDAGEILYQVFRLSEARPIAAGGESVFRFYLRQTVGDGGAAVSCSPAVLLIDEDLALTREKVMAVTVPEKAVTLSPAQLPDYLAALPKLLTEKLVITLTAGTLTQPLTISGFYGPGQIRLNGVSASTVCFQDGIRIEGCRAPIYLVGLRFMSPSSKEACINGSFSGYIWVQNCVLQGADAEGKRAFYMEACHATVQGCSITHFKYVLATLLNASVELFALSASDNTVGIEATRGGVAALGTEADSKLGGVANAKLGGIIINQNGTLL